MAKPRKITEKEIYELTELVKAERSCCPTEEELDIATAANILRNVAERGTQARGKFLREAEIFELGKGLFLLCQRHSSTESDPLLSLLAGWREGEMEQHREDLRLLY